MALLLPFLKAQRLPGMHTCVYIYTCRCMQNVVRERIRTFHALPTSLAHFCPSLFLSFTFSLTSTLFTSPLIRSQLQFRLKQEMGHTMWSSEKLSSSRILSPSPVEILLFFFFYSSDSYFLTSEID